MKMQDSRINYNYPSRITMLDADALDNEIFIILKSQLKAVLQNVPVWVLQQHELKLDLILHYVLWKLSIRKFHGTFGQQLLNMKYIDRELTSNKERLLLLSQISSYLHKHNLLSSFLGNPKLANIFDVLFQFFELANMLVFFSRGIYPSLSNRALGLRLVCIVNKPRSISYNYMTRELLWHGFLELFTFTLSIVNYQFLRRKIARLCSSYRTVQVTRKPDSYYNQNCVVCSRSPVLPQSIGCSHVFCYYCLQVNRKVDSKFECPSCFYFQEKIEFVRP